MTSFADKAASTACLPGGRLLIQSKKLHSLLTEMKSLHLITLLKRMASYVFASRKRMLEYVYAP